jgi:ParB-like chromosome segregation protein Spo0J
MYFKELELPEIELLPQKMRPQLKPLSAKELAEMKKSLKDDGVLQNLVVSEKRENGKISYVLEAGYTRYALAKELGIKKVPCQVNTLDRVVSLRAGTDAYRRNLTEAERGELVGWVETERELEEEHLRQLREAGQKIEPPAAKTKGKTVVVRASKVDAALKRELEKTKDTLTKKEEQINTLKTEIKDIKEMNKKTIDGLKEDIKTKTTMMSSIAAELKQEKENLEELNFQKKAAEGPAKAEIEKLFKERMKDSTTRVKLLEEELKNANEENETLKEAKEKAENEAAGLIANHSAILYNEREKYRAEHERYLIMMSLNQVNEILEDLIPNHIDKINEYVRRNDVRIEMNQVSDLLGKTEDIMRSVSNAVNSIPLIKETVKNKK